MIKVERVKGDRIAFSVQGEMPDLVEECEILVRGMFEHEMLRIFFIHHLEEALPELLKEISNDKNNTSNKSDK